MKKNYIIVWVRFCSGSMAIRVRFCSGSCLVCKGKVRVLFGSFKNEGSSSVRSVLVPYLVAVFDIT